MHPTFRVGLYNANHSNHVGVAHDSHVLLLQLGSWARLGSRAFGLKSSKARALEDTSFMQGLTRRNNSLNYALLILSAAYA